MFRLFFTPGWFNEFDLLFKGIGLLVALLIAAYSWKFYRIDKDNKFAYFSLAFVFVSLSLGISIFTSGVLNFFPLRETVAQVLSPITGEGLRFSELFYRAAFFVEMASMLGAWLLIFLISQKPRDRLKRYFELSQIGLFVYLVLLISWVANFKYVVFYLTSLVLLSLIVLNYYKNYLNKNKNKNAFSVMSAFFLIMAGNLFLVFVFLHSSLYAAGQLLMLSGSLLLLRTYRRVVRG